jgi:hypothetical protein
MTLVWLASGGALVASLALRELAAPDSDSLLAVAVYAALAVAILTAAWLRHQREPEIEWRRLWGWIRVLAPAAFAGGAALALTDSAEFETNDWLAAFVSLLLLVGGFALVLPLAAAFRFGWNPTASPLTASFLVALAVGLVWALGDSLFGSPEYTGWAVGLTVAIWVLPAFWMGRITGGLVRRVRSWLTR